MDQVHSKWGPGLKAKEANLSATEPSRTLKRRGRSLLLFFLSAILLAHDYDTMVTTNGSICLLLLILILEGSYCNTRYFVKMRTNASELFKTRSDNLRVTQEPIAATQNPLFDETRIDNRNNDERMIRDALNSEYDKRNSFETSTFNPDVLNKFLEEYANKIKSSTEKDFKIPYKISKPTVDPLVLEVNESTTDAFTTIVDDEKSTLDQNNSTVNEDKLTEVLNDTLKRNKYYGMSTNDDRNGWVTLDAIPWSKSKISKWQANPSTQRPWPEIKPWDKPSIAKPWTSDYPSRPTYENNKPWNEKPKPYWQENNNEKPWQKPSSSSRPSYYSDNKYDQVSSQAQKWPPEKPSWEKYASDLHRPSDIITDDRPTNFPNSWNRPQSSRPYPYLDRYPDNNHADESTNDWHDFPPRTDSLDRPRPNDRPHFSHYQYSNTHPPSHPANGDGQWVLLSTNRGYSKSRQRSIKVDTLTPEMVKGLNGSKIKTIKREDADPSIPVMTSKRQVDSATVDQRHQHDDFTRRSAGSREDLQERRTEPQGVRERQNNNNNSAEYNEKETNQEHSEWGTGIELSGSRGSRGRYATSNYGNDDPNDARPEETRSDVGGGLYEKVSHSRNKSA
ncbi:hypothetical protein KPH14_004391 [Odynerus spinipes]|uniref:Uncharacterized protein n=1 Tax=Odynerus spinipes TaxID=1348599 RepID=A0AAD9VW56_9HYME|nr:hypothetical protein KPH14_004391 [Odynerus spinipes]